MADILPFRRPSPKKIFRENTLCEKGLHEWEVFYDNQFDVKYARLVTVYRCRRCGKERALTHELVSIKTR